MFLKIWHFWSIPACDLCLRTRGFGWCGNGRNRWRVRVIFRGESGRTWEGRTFVGWQEKGDKDLGKTIETVQTNDNVTMVTNDSGGPLYSLSGYNCVYLPIYEIIRMYTFLS